MSDDRTIRDLRLEKLAKLRELGFDPFAVERFDTPTSIADLHKRFDELAPIPGDDGHPSPEDIASKTISLAGRLVSLREMGKAAFANVSDGDDKIQAYFRKNDLDELQPGAWEAFKLLDIGDHVGITGYLFRTKTGEQSIYVRSLTPLSKSLHTLPLGKEKDGEQWYGLSDVDQRYRHRNLDLVANKDARTMLLNRSRIVSAVRRFFDDRGYFEVETPMLQLEAGGAAARPFKTHYNAYDMDVKLRISLELYLKRIICGDVPKVYEIGRVFRNEGVSNRHNPEFTLLEWYEAYANLEDMMSCVEDLFKDVAQKVLGSAQIVPKSLQATINREPGSKVVKQIYAHGIELSLLWQGESLDISEPLRAPLTSGQGIPLVWGHEFTLKSGLAFVLEERPMQTGLLLVQQHSVFEDARGESVELEPGRYFYAANPHEIKGPTGSRIIDFGKPWHRVDMLTAIHERSGIAPEELRDLESAKAAMKRVGLPTEKENNLGGIIEKLLEHFVEPHLQEPTFVIGYPIETSPLAKKDPNRPGFTRRFEGYVLGREVCNAFSEINDPIDQRERFEQQLSERAKGDDEAHPMDEDFLFALENGMPPTGGCGIGIDRLVMLLTGAEHLREILLFPMMRPDKPQGDDEDDEDDD